MLNNTNRLLYTDAVMAQSQISRTVRGVRERARIAEILSQERCESRRALGRRVCQEFSFFDAIGRPQVSG